MQLLPRACLASLPHQGEVTRPAKVSLPPLTFPCLGGEVQQQVLEKGLQKTYPCSPHPSPARGKGNNFCLDLTTHRCFMQYLPHETTTISSAERLDETWRFNLGQKGAGLWPQGVSR